MRILVIGIGPMYRLSHEILAILQRVSTHEVPTPNEYLIQAWDDINDPIIWEEVCPRINLTRCMQGIRKEYQYTLAQQFRNQRIVSENIKAKGSASSSRSFFNARMPRQCSRKSSGSFKNTIPR
jgi:hypothetical protein